MTNLADHPLLFIAVTLFSLPIYKGIALAIFGSRQGLQAAWRHVKSAETWSPFRDPWANDWRTDFKLFFCIALCISYVAAICHLLARYVL